jgi:hypothetical protein
MPTVETPNSAHELLIPEELNFLAPLVVTDLIRIGRENDGGYGVPKSLIREAEILVSMGINDDWSFDEECLKLNRQEASDGDYGCLPAPDVTASVA